MPVKITRAFQWSPNGYDVATVEAGEHESLPDRAFQIAAQLGAVGEGAAPPVPAPVGGVTLAVPDVQGQASVAEQPSGERSGVALPTTQATETAPAAEAKPGRRRNRAPESQNG
jgi:hypothetical protein